MADNRWYINDENTLVEFTVARASQVEAKLDDVAEAFDLLETEFDAMQDDIDLNESRSVRLASDTLDALDENAATRATKVIGFDAAGAVELKEVSSVGAVLDSYTVVSSATTLASNTMYYVVSGSYTLTLPASPDSGDFIVLKFDGSARDTPVTIDANGSSIESYSEVYADMNYLELHLIYTGAEWKL